jgi:hypothetical protein
MFGMSIVVLIILHLLAATFLHQRIAPSDDNRAALRSKSSFANVLRQSRDSIQKHEKMKHSIEMKHTQEVDFPGKKKIPSPDVGVNDARENTKRVGAKSRPLDEDKKRPKQQDGENDTKIVENKTVAEQNDKLEAPDEKHEAVNHPEEQGTRVTDKAFIHDFAFDRQHPTFRMQDIEFPPLDARLESLVSCGYISQHRLLTHKACRNEDTLLTAHNPLPFTRYWCGKELAPNAVKRFDEPCLEPVRVFVKNAPVNGQGMPPIQITATKGSTNLRDVECDIPCQQEVDIKGDTLYIEGTDWKITSTTRALKLDGNAFRQNEYYSTPSFSSSVPLSPFHFDDYNLTVVPVSFEDTLASASYLIDKDCNSPGSKRHRWSGAIEKHLPVAYYGSCSHNTDLPENMSLSNKNDRVQLHRKHRFNLAFEATNEKDYITEVIFDAFQSGSLPVILGPSNIEDHFPPNSFINAGRFQYWDDLGKYVKQVSENKTLWESYFEWRKDPNSLNDFFQRLNFTKTSSTCRMCQWAYAKQYGLGWNHVQQVVQETAIPRELCLNSELVTRPFVESYLSKSKEIYEDIAVGVHDSKNCVNDDAALHASFNSNGFQVERTVESHDGVTDLVIDHLSRPSADSADLLLRLEFDLNNVDGAFFSNPHTLVSTIRGPLYSSIGIQDERSKVTVLANWETQMRSTCEGTIEVVVYSSTEGTLQEGELRRIRVIVEDLNTIQDKMTEYFPSSFGNLMIHDFVDPLELYYNTE